MKNHIAINIFFTNPISTNVLAIELLVKMLSANQIAGFCKV